MTLTTILIIILILILLGAVPAWPYSRGWGYGPSGIVGVILVILLDPRADGPRLSSSVGQSADKPVLPHSCVAAI